MSNNTKPTIYAVADHAGVSISTVSRVLNESTAVTDTTRQRVVDAMNVLQYRPDRTARSLAQRRKRTLAVALPSFTTPFHNEVLKGVRQGLGDRDVDLLLWDLEWNGVRASLLKYLRRGAVDGVLLIGVEEDEHVARELKAMQAPVVHIGRRWNGFDCFYWDHVAGAREAVRHLILQGHTSIGMISSAMHSVLQQERMQGYREAMEEAGLAFRPEYVQTGATSKHAGYSEEAGYEAMQRLMEVDSAITAVFASSDVQAIGAWKALREAGRSVPDDVALVGYDDVKTSAFLGLSSVAQAMHDVGVQAAEACVKQIVGGRRRSELCRSVLITPRLEVRSSSKRVVEAARPGAASGAAARSAVGHSSAVAQA